MSGILRLESVNGSPVVEYRLRDGAVERRALLPDGRIPRDGAEWEVVSATDLVAQMHVDGPVAAWLRAHAVEPLR